MIARGSVLKPIISFNFIFKIMNGSVFEMYLACSHHTHWNDRQCILLVLISQVCHFYQFILQVCTNEWVAFKRYKIKGNLHVVVKEIKSLILLFILGNMSLSFT